MIHRLGDEVIEIRCSTKADGDFHRDQPPEALATRQQAFVAGPWTQLAEVHGGHAVVVTTPGEHDGAAADAMVTQCREATLGIWVGDCAPVVLVGASGWIGAAHAGWRGARAGVLERVVAAMPGGATHAYLGPCIHPCCYEFGAADLATMVARYGDAVAGRTRAGVPALDMPAVVRAALEPLGVHVRDIGGCTGCNADRWFSHRARRDPQRHVMTITKRAV